ncbi:GNAT family N-acetyltransferase [Lutibacter sp.]|uniref:GNAT family N-acetyltransferase n=1 Tax=Lutibacter sp. TaxID=1925666 RepID=UPI0035686061
MKIDLSFEKCTLKNLVKLVEISKSTFINAFEKDNNPEDFNNYINSALSKGAIKVELINPNSTFYFAYFKNELIGYFKLNEKEAQTEQYSQETIELERIYVLNQFQGQQLGKHILLEIINIAKAKQVSFLWLGVWEKNTAAIRFYKRYGFKKFDTHFYYIGTDKQTDWLMKLDFV